LNLKLKKSDVKKKFKVNSITASHIISSQQQEVDADSSGNLDFEEFQVFLERLRVRPEVDELFYKIAKNGFFTPEEFKKWINTEQGEDLPLETIKNLIAQLEKKDHGKDAANLYVTGFSAYLASPQYNRYSTPFFICLNVMSLCLNVMYNFFFISNRCVLYNLVVVVVVMFK
jgi:phosphatidylinositol phospholipase C delta